MRVTFVISSLGNGGAEKNAVDLCNRLTAEGHRVSLFTWEDERADQYALPRDVRRVVLGHARPSKSALDAIRSNMRRIRALRSALAEERPDVALAFMGRTGIVTVLAARRLKIPTVITERTDPREEPLGRAWSLLRRWAYGRAAAVVANSQSVAEWLRAWLPPERVERIPNIVEIGRDADAVPEFPVPSRPFVLAVGRLVEGKGHADLIRAFARCGENEWDLMILGKGSARPALLELSKTVGLDGRVHLPGHAANPLPFYRAAGLFAFPSYREGFPNALLEAMAMGNACVSYDCHSGPNEIIDDGYNGRLVPVADEQQLAGRLGELMRDPDLRHTYGERAQAARARYAPHAILPQWETLLDRVRRKP